VLDIIFGDGERVASQEVGKHLTAVTPTDAGTREEFEADKTVAMSGDVAAFVIEWKRKVLWLGSWW